MQIVQIHRSPWGDNDNDWDTLNLSENLITNLEVGGEVQLPDVDGLPTSILNKKWRTYSMFRLRGGDRKRGVRIITLPDPSPRVDLDVDLRLSYVAPNLNPAPVDETKTECPLGKTCQSVTCFKMHPCTGRNCHHYGKVWLDHSFFNYTRGNKRSLTCVVYRDLHNGIHNAASSERKRLKREEHELAAHPELDLTDEAKEKAVADALDRFRVELARLRQQYPGRIFSVNVFGASTGSEGYSIIQEGEKSTLTERGYDTPAIVARCASDRGWRALDGSERRLLGPPAVQLANAGVSKGLSKHVETEVQDAVEQMRGIQQMWRVKGAGGPKGLPNYCVGARFIVHGEAGRLPEPFYHTIPTSPMVLPPVFPGVV